MVHRHWLEFFSSILLADELSKHCNLKQQIKERDYQEIDESISAYEVEYIDDACMRISPKLLNKLTNAKKSAYKVPSCC